MCKDCEARREMARAAFLKAKIGTGIGHIVRGAAEAVGIKEKTGSKEHAAASKTAPKGK